MSSRSTARARYSFANLDEVLELPDLIAIQRESFEWFLEHGLAETFADISPIKDFTETLQLELEFDPHDEDLRPPPKFSVDECKEKDMTYSAPIFVRARFMNATTGEIKEQTVFMGDFPMMTDKGTFVINGTERVVVSQLVRSPGVIFQPGERFRLRNLAKHQLVTGTIHPYRGEWIEFDVEQKPGKDVTAGTRVARKRRLSLFVLLRALGYDEENHPGFLDQFVRHFDFLEGQWEKDREIAPTQDEALVEIYKRARPGEPPSVESAEAYFKNAFVEGRRYDLSRVGRYKLNRKLGPELDRIESIFGIQLERPDPDQSVLTPAEILAATTYLLNLVNAEPGYRLDDQDHFANRRIRSVGELIQNQVRIGLSRMERVVRERMTTQDVEAITPQTLINIRPVVAAIKEFFGTSQLSQFMDQVNPLSGLNHRRRLSALGPGGLSRERAGFEVRDVHFSHYGRMCPIETPEGPNIGLIGQLSSFARVNSFGFIESPYRKVVDGKVTDEVVYLAADEEEEYVVAQANAPLNDDGTFRNDRVLVRRSPQAATLGELKLQLERDVFFGATTEISSVPPEEVQLMDVSPKQIVSIGAAAIPFLEHDDANRALMGANMQKQAVPLIKAEAPYIGTGIESTVARDSGDLIFAEDDGTVAAVDGDAITVEYKSLGKKIYRLLKFERSNQDTCINQKVRVAEGDKVAAGQLVARLDDAMIAIEITRQEAAIREAEAAVEDASAARERADALLSRQSVSQETAELAATAERAAEARLIQAKAALEALQVERLRTQISAPVAGIVSAPPATIGTIVQNGTEIARLVRDGRLEVAAKVPEQHLAGIAPGQAVTVTDAAGNIVDGTVRGVAEQVDAATRIGTVYVALPADSGLRPGMFARVTIATSIRYVASVPQAAISWRDGGSYVFVLGAGDTVEMRPVEIGSRDGDAIAVTAGLVAGETVVTTGGGFLNDGNRVRLAGTESAGLGAEDER
mgnify:CR=1 FL=1